MCTRMINMSDCVKWLIFAAFANQMFMAFSPALISVTRMMCVLKRTCLTMSVEGVWIYNVWCVCLIHRLFLKCYSVLTWSDNGSDRCKCSVSVKQWWCCLYLLSLWLLILVYCLLRVVAWWFAQRLLVNSALC